MGSAVTPYRVSRVCSQVGRVGESRDSHDHRDGRRWDAWAVTPRTERVIFIAHGVIMLAAAIVLVVFPAAIPATVGIALARSEYLLPYVLAAAELGIGLLSLGAARLRDPDAIRLIALSFAAFHGTTAVLEVIPLAAIGVSGVLIANIVVRMLVSGLFVLIARRRR